MQYDIIAHPADMKLYRTKFATEKQRAIWSEENIISKRLLVEVTLAEAQAEMGMIPKKALAEIKRKANLKHFTAERYADLYALKGHDIVALVWGLNEICEDGWGEYVHWRSTTQDILWTSTALLLRESIDDLIEEMQLLEGEFLELMEEHKTTVMPGRTHGQHCPPISFGFLLGIQASALRRHIERMKAERKTTVVAKITSAVGTGSSYGTVKETLDLGQRIADKLDLDVPTISESEAARDRVQGPLAVCSMVSVGLEKTARDFWTMQRPEIGEVAEPFREGDQVGSSTLAHKRNPFGCEWIMGLAKLVRSSANVVMDLYCPDIRDASRLAVEYVAVPQALMMTAAICSQMRGILSGLTVNKERMAKNCWIEGGLSMDEPVMLALAPHLGRQSAHDLIYEITHACFHQKKTLKKGLLQNRIVMKYLDDKEIDRLTRYENYLGTAPKQVELTIAAIRKARRAEGSDKNEAKGGRKPTRKKAKRAKARR